MRTNNLYNQLSGNPTPQMASQQGVLPRNTVEELSNFAQHFKGDPKQQALDMLKNSVVSQQDFNNAVAQANALYGTIFGQRR